jgi:hypothetical protein
MGAMTMIDSQRYATRCKECGQFFVYEVADHDEPPALCVGCSPNLIDGCDIVKVAHKLAGELEGYPLPDDWAPENTSDPAIWAAVRHNYTNYEGLLHELPTCKIYHDPDIECTQWPSDDTGECPLREQAHNILKWAATDIARELTTNWYEIWYEKQEEDIRALKEGRMENGSNRVAGTYTAREI